MTEERRVQFWVVVSVERGIPVDVHICRDMDEAMQRERTIREDIDEVEDETAVFQVYEDDECEEIVFVSNRKHMVQSEA